MPDDREDTGAAGGRLGVAMPSSIDRQGLVLVPQLGPRGERFENGGSSDASIDTRCVVMTSRY